MSAPLVAGLSPDNVYVQLHVDEPCRVHFVVEPQGSAPKTVADILAGTVRAAGGHSGSAQVPATTESATPMLLAGGAMAALPILQANTAYTVFLVAVDEQPGQFTQEVATVIEFTTSDGTLQCAVAPPCAHAHVHAHSTRATPLDADTQAPHFLLGAPAMGAILDTSVHVTVALNEPGTVYCLALLASDPASISGVSSEQVVESPAAVEADVGYTTPVTFAVPALQESTHYLLWLVAVDAHGNRQAVASELPVTTLHGKGALPNPRRLVPRSLTAHVSYARQPRRHYSSSVCRGLPTGCRHSGHHLQRCRQNQRGCYGVCLGHTTWHTASLGTSCAQRHTWFGGGGPAAPLPGFSNCQR